MFHPAGRILHTPIPRSPVQVLTAIQQTGTAQGGTGPAGATGIAGGTGLRGATGVDGARGDTGIQGTTGQDGARGDTGATGIGGAPGATGAQGDTGIRGVDGAPGTTGVQGDVGATGVKGSTGTVGVRGVTGLVGYTGASGVTGAGVQGATGVQGTQGNTGVAGSQGITGLSGAAGSDPAIIYPYGNIQYGKPKLAKAEYASLASGATMTLLDTTGGASTQGYIDHMWIGMDGNDVASREASLLKIYIDGESTASFQCTLGSLLMSYWGPSFLTRTIGFLSYATSHGSGHVNHKIPFNSSVKVTITNGGNSTCNVFADISYKTGANINWGRAKRLMVNQQIGVACVPNSANTLLDVAGRGLFYGLCWNAQGPNADYKYLEGNFKMYIDGESTPSLEWSGTEDYFLNGAYFAGGKLTNEEFGCTTMYSGNQVSAYRFHLSDPIPFDTHCKFVWNCGDTTQSNYTGNTTLWYGAFYYLDQ